VVGAGEKSEVGEVKRIGLLFVFIVLLLSAGAASAISYYDDFSGSLNLSFWKVVTKTSGATVNVQNGTLVLKAPASTGTGKGDEAEVDSPSIDVSHGAVIEFRVKTDIKGTGQATYGATRKYGLKVGGSNFIWFEPGKGGQFELVGPDNNNIATLNIADAQQFSDYKFVIKDGTVTAYLNGNPVGQLKINSTNVTVFFYVKTWWAGSGLNHPAEIWVDWVNITNEASVKFYFRDGLTGQPLQGVTVKEGNSTLGTLDNGGTLKLVRGPHVLTFEKQGYWSVTETVNVGDNTSVSVEMYPSSASFKLENFPANISIPENTIYTLTFTLSPIQTSATYNTYLSLSGLSGVLEVRKDGSLVSPENGKYYLGDISSPVQVSIKFKAGSVGTHGFTITLTSNDAIMSKTYTTTKQVVYKVEPLPFSVQMPSEWQVGTNELRISESSGQSYLITAVLKDSQGNEVWSDSYAFSPYEAHTFTVNVPSEGSYTLELQWNGRTAVYDITVNPAITLKTKTLTVSEGSEGVITLHFKNPSSDVQYYTIKLSGGFLPAEINQSISVGPLTEKDVSIAFAVPEKLTYDAYELNVQVLQGNATVFSDRVAVSISDSSSFSLFGGGSSGGKTLYYGLAALVGLGLFVAILRRR